MKQGEAEPSNVFKLRFHNVYEITELAEGDNILYRKQLTKNVIQASTKEKKCK